MPIVPIYAIARPHNRTRRPRHPFDLATIATTGVDFLNSQSPLFKADAIRVPLLIGQGANDPRVNIRESTQIVDAMRKKNLPVTYVVFPDEGHGFARPENNKHFDAETEAFLK